MSVLTTDEVTYLRKAVGRDMNSGEVAWAVGDVAEAILDLIDTLDTDKAVRGRLEKAIAMTLYILESRTSSDVDWALRTLEQTGIAKYVPPVDDDEENP